MLELLIENSKHIYDELAKKLSKTRENVRANLKMLEYKKLIERIGADKNGYWKVLIQ